MESILPQVLINGLISGSIYALAASGFSLVYFVVKFLHFAQGATITLSAYLFFLFLNIIGLNYVLAAIITVGMSIMITLLMNFLVYKPLRKRKATNVILMISSLAILTLSSSLILAIFGSSTKTIALNKQDIIKNIIKNVTFDLGIFTITVLQIIIMIFALMLFLLLWLIIKKTRLGKSLQAVADNKEVSQIVGINPEKIYSYTFIIAAILGGISGILIGLEQNLYPRMGIPIIVKGFISSVVGGISSVHGAIIGGLFIGLVENLGILFLPSVYKDVISFTILLIFLLLRPYGILGVSKREDVK